MKLYKLEASNSNTFFGIPADKLNIDEFNTTNTIRIAQTPNCDAFLLLSKDAQDGLELLDSVPAGFNFTYCQEWGMGINDDIVADVILDLRRKAYGTWENQLEKIYDYGIDSWKVDVAAVKAKYPKG